MKRNIFSKRLLGFTAAFCTAALLFFAYACDKTPGVVDADFISPSEGDLSSAELRNIAEGYLIGFEAIPDADLIRGVGGSVIRTYRNFPVMHIKVPEQALQGLARNPNVTFVEPNGIVKTMSDYDYSDYCPRASLACVDGRIKTFHVSRIGAQAAWRSGATGDGIRLAIVDSGIRADHKDLKDNVAQDGFSAVKTGPPSDRHHNVDPNGHGTHVAGIAGASGILNGYANALVGVAPEVTLVSVKVLDKQGYGSWADVAAGIDWCIDNNIDIVNMSLGGGYSQAVEEAVKTAWDEGLLLVAAAGNEGNSEGTGDNVGYPAAFDEVIAVAGTVYYGTNRLGFSSTGPQLELIAGGGTFSTYNNDFAYAYLVGTSMASPHVAGVAALVWSNEPGLTNKEVRTRLRENVEPLDAPKEHVGHGLVRADKALGIETGHIRGLAIESDTKNAIYAGTVAVNVGEDLYRTSTSGPFGYYLFVPPGEHEVTASYGYGYDPVTEIATVVAEELTTLQLMLPPEGFVPVQQYTVSGTVTDDYNNELADATVSIDGTTHLVTTDGNGFYEIGKVNEDFYHITASLSGYQSQTKSIILDKDLTINFSLAELGSGDLSIDRFDLTSTSNPQFARVRVDWEVSGEDLTEVKLEITGPNSDSRTWNVSGNSAYGQHEFSFRRGFGSYTVTITVTDEIGSLSESKHIQL